MAVIGITYDGGNHYDDDGNLIENPIQYESVYLYTSKERTEFNSGDFVKDWHSAHVKYFDGNKNEPLSHSSTVNHFIMDGAPYSSAYLHYVNDEYVLKYVDRSNPNYLYSQREIYENGLELFVAENTQPTWEEYKQLIK